VLELIKQDALDCHTEAVFRPPTSAAETYVSEFYGAALFRYIHESVNINKMAYITFGVDTRFALIVVVVVVVLVRVMRTTLLLLLHNDGESVVNLLNTKD
jgi:hypothetical protein